MDFVKVLSEEFQIRSDRVGNIISLIDEGNTIPFIARYRKELTGSCDDQVLRAFADRLQYLRNLEKRKQEVIDSITEQEKMTSDLQTAIEQAKTLAEVEDLYRPYKPKRRTRASVAREKGLAPLAQILFAQTFDGELASLCAEYISEEKGVLSAQDALQGASDIIAEEISDDAQARKQLKAYIRAQGQLASSGDAEQESVYTTYYDFSEPIRKIPSHRVLAINRGEAEGFLKVGVVTDEDKCLDILYKQFITAQTASSAFCRESCRDAWERLIRPSVEREIRADLTETASEQAIRMFGLNLKPLLMQPPVRGKVVLAVDPAYRTGCKIAVVDATGKVLTTGVIYPTPPQNKKQEAADKLCEWIIKYGVDCISIGNGTASKEAEIFVAQTIKTVARDVSYMVVNEAGASVYSASKLGAQEFPDFDVSVRSAVSIARRLQDPLAELVKIDPKSIGVGQYQHDMPQARLDESLRGVVEDCVNRVGVDLNTASASLLGYVSGISAAVAKNIVLYREENGRFQTRAQLKHVNKLGPKAYEQCAGFLRIPGGKNPLDNTGVHPERYETVKKLLELFGHTVSDVGAVSFEKCDIKKLADELDIGVPTLTDILTELAKPGRDVRDELPPPILRTDIMDINDLKPGMELTGTVRNVIDFGAFVDIGVHQDGLVHISEISDKYIKHPSEVLKVGDVVAVTVLGVDSAKKRISLTMKQKNKTAGE